MIKLTALLQRVRFFFVSYDIFRRGQRLTPVNHTVLSGDAKFILLTLVKMGSIELFESFESWKNNRQGTKRG